MNRTSLEETDATATATYSITVIDINDEAPEFQQSVYNISITEIQTTSLPVQVTGLTIVCIDKDEVREKKDKERVKEDGDFGLLKSEI